jgi:hypothetical protein
MTQAESLIFRQDEPDRRGKEIKSGGMCRIGVVPEESVLHIQFILS